MNEAPRSKDQVIPDVFIDATPEDTERLTALIDGLRALGLNVEHFDDGLLAHGPRAELARSRIRLGRVVLAPLRALQTGLGGVDWARHTFVTSPATIFGLRFEETDVIPDIRLTGVLELRTRADLDQALSTIATITSAATRSSASTRASGGSPASSSAMPNNPAPRPRADAGALRLQLGNETGQEEWPVAPALRDVLQSAARFWPSTTKEPERFTLSFKTLLLSLFNTAERWSIWARETGARTGFRAERVFDEQGLTRDEIAERVQRPLNEAETSARFAATTSAAAILRSAREHAHRTESELDVQHVLAAVIHDPAGHEAELARWGFKPAAWSAALAEEVASRVPQQAGYFARLHAERFPARTGDAQKVLHPDRRLESWEMTFWSEAHAELRDALALAAGFAAQSKANTALTPLHLLAGILGRGPANVLAQAWIKIAPPKAEHASLHSAQAALASLGLPTTPPAPAQLDQLPELDASARATIQAAHRPVSQGRGGTSVMDVFIALCTPGDDGEAAIDAILRAREIDPDFALERLCADPGLGSHADALRALLDRRRAAIAWIRPEIGNDRVDGAVPFERDMLDVGPAAKRFAKLLADVHVKPPIAVGLFGNWGSGKTFFMGLMRSHVKELMEMRSTRYARRVVQIEFNAWHYHDTNLWASLAIHIFDRLAHALSETSETSIETTRRQLHERMSSSVAHRNEAQAQRDAALGRRTIATQLLETKRRQRDEAVRSSISRRISIAWDALRNGKTFEPLRKASDDLAEQFGVVRLGESVESVHALRADIEKTRAHAFGLFTAIGHRFKGTRSVSTITFLLGVVLLALALGWGTERVFERLQMLAPRYSGTVIEVATMLSVVVAWCGRRVRQLQSGLDMLGALEADLVAAGNRVDASKNEPLRLLEQQIATLDKEILDADGKIAAADQEIAQAQAEIDRINRGGLVYDFLQQRRTSATYVGQLGLVSTIRQDLQDLDLLLEDFAKNAKDDAPAIDRILLYIDDLDRCHPDKVLEVLQAVHLLLTFDLFNVVVGVDARWLERSLRRQYEQKLGGRGLAADGFSPQDYLEKIFQIPFALGGMDSKGFKKFVGDMVETRTEWAQRKEREEKEALEQKEKDAQAARAAAAQPKPAEKESATPADTKSEAETARPKETSGTEPSPSKTTPTVAAAANAAAKPETKEPPQYLEDHELAFIDALHPFIDRPRLAKRFVNIYKLLRVTADDEGGGATFSRPAVSEEYRAALILLAIHIGHHGLSTKLVPEILRADAEATWSSVLDDLGDPKRAGARLSNDERQALALVRAKLARLDVPVPDGLAAYRHWAKRVLCYSFEPLRLGATPADLPLSAPQRAPLVEKATRRA